MTRAGQALRQRRVALLHDINCDLDEDCWCDLKEAAA